MIEQSESIVKLSAAMVAASAELKNPPKDSVNPHYKSRFADLATVLDTVKPTLIKNRLAVMQFPTESNGLPALATMVVHESGEWIRTTMLLCPAKSDPQGIGSAITYGRRYGLQAALGITADDDDDGHQGSQPAKQTQQPAKTAPQQQNQAPVDNRIDGKTFQSVMNAKGFAWVDVIGDINHHEKTKYPNNAKYTDIAAGHLAAFFAHIQTLPDIKK